MKQKTTLSHTDQQAFTAYLQGKGLSISSIISYRSNVELFFSRTSKEGLEITKTDILKHLEHLRRYKKQQSTTRKLHLIALNHYFTFLIEQEIITKNPCLSLKLRGTKKQKLHQTFTTEEIQNINDNYYEHYVRNYDDSHIKAHNREHAKLSRERNATMLGILLYQGVTTKEVDQIELRDIDLIKAKIEIKGGKKSNKRTLELRAGQIGMLLYYLQNTRPKLLEYNTIESEKLFLPLPAYSQKTTNKENIMHIFKQLTKQVKAIEPSFINFKQIRASVITHWLKTKNLRQAQYLAGHRYISSTENYLPQNIENLSKTINEIHPY